ncbi:CHAT domain-containing protein [Micromonospora sp. B9E7]|uniref:CHAT domain-containing protein n=1 Tax=Micromonospora sp. B9E7 TaxID=3153574 RepID=UPI00325DFD4F
MRDVLLADLVGRVSNFQAGGPPQRVLDADGLGVAADLLRLTADEVTDRESVDTDALYAAAAYYHARFVAWQHLVTSVEPDSHAPSGQDSRRSAREELVKALDLYGLLFLADHRRVPRDLWPYVIRATGHDPWRDPLDRAADLIIDGEESGSLVPVDEAIALLRALTDASDAGGRDTLLGHALLLRASATDAPAARRRADVDSAVDALSAASVRSEVTAELRSTRQSALGNAYLTRFAVTKDPRDLLAAESAYRAALADVAADSREYANACAGVGTALGRRAEVAVPAEQQAVRLLREAAEWLRRATDGDPSSNGEAALANLRRVMALWIRENARTARATDEADSAVPAALPVGNGDRPAPHAYEADVRQANALAQLSVQVGARVLPEAEGFRRVVDPAFALSAAAVDLVVEAAVNRRRRDVPADVVLLLRLAMAAAESRWGATRDGPWWRAADAYVEAVRHSLADTPSGERLVEAHNVLTRQLTLLRAREAEERDELSGTLFAAGLLHLSPYMAHTSGLSFDGAHSLWLARHRRQSMAGPERSDDVDPSPLPSPMAAAEQAVGYLERAAELARGHERGRALKALAEARSFLAGLRQESADQEIRLACREAFALLNPAHDVIGYLYLLRILNRFGEVGLPDELVDLLPVPLATLRDRYGLNEASSTFAEALTLAAEAVRPDLEAELLAAADDELPRLWNDAHRRQRWMSEVHLLVDGHLPCSPALREIPELVEQARALADEDSWSGAEWAATLIHLAAHSPVDGAHQLGRDLIAEAHEAAPQLWDWHHDAIDYLDAGLAYDLATQADSADAHGDAAREYGSAALRYALCGQLDLALNSLDGGLQQVFACDDATAGRAATALLPAAAGLGAGADESVAWTLHQFYRRLLFGLIGSSVDVAAVAVVHQAAKGRGFSSALRSRGPLTATPRLLRDLQRTRADEALLPGPPPDVELPGGAETAMVCYAGSAEAETESDVDAVHRNRQRASDRRVSDELTTARSPWRLPLLALDEVQALLPPETVLVSLMLGEGRRDAAGPPVAALHGLAISRDSVEHRSMLLPQFAGGLIRFYRGTHHLTLSPLALRVADLRRAITADPLHRVVTRDAQQILAERPDTFLAGFLDRVPHWHAEGRRHLCVWADGPLHYVPFHLLAAGSGTLADDWTVTQVPSAELLRGRPPSTRWRFLAFASAAGGTRHGLPAEDALEVHAAQVAEAMAGEAILGTAATPQRFLAALAEARYIHVAAHGAHNEWAPWFQCLYLSPGADDDGRVFAHDILRTDLRGVDLVTLSACESALGRFDPNDNLRGLPAALLSAGATTVIGCLWPVHPQVATDFFGHLYQRLASDPDRRAAFDAAQRATRDRHPAYRDWGTFVFIGDWRTIATTEEPTSG